jgi:hypothetical protein
MDVRDGPLLPKGHQQLTSIAASTALTVPAGARYAILKCTAQAVRWRDDGVDPTAAIGMLLDVGDEFLYTGKLAAVRVIEAAGGGVLNVAYYA